MKSIIVSLKFRTADSEDWHYVTDSVEFGEGLYFTSAHKYMQHIKNLYKKSGFEWRITEVVIG